ncbi:MAG: LssY C-terminal domain-containing protein [Phycisphaerales bacterium]
MTEERHYPADTVTNRPLVRRMLRIGALVLVAYFLVAYVAIPILFRASAAVDPRLKGVTTITHTADGHPGDPVNLMIVGSEDDLISSMLAAGWHPADPVTLRSSIRIAASVVMRREYEDAPVSALYLFGHKQDLAFEQEAGADATRRSHVRFWKSPDPDASGRPVYFGSITFDASVGLSHATGQITHHISPDVDAPRDQLIKDLQSAGRVANLAWIDGFQVPPEGRNGGNDPWHTDGRLAVITLATGGEAPAASTPATTRSASMDPVGSRTCPAARFDLAPTD